MTEENLSKYIYIKNIESLRNSKNMKKGEFCKYIKIANLYRNDSKMPGDKVLRLIQEKFPYATKDWLFTDHDVKYLTGNGKNEDTISHPQPEYNVSAKQLLDSALTHHLIKGLRMQPLLIFVHVWTHFSRASRSALF